LTIAPGIFDFGHVGVLIYGSCRCLTKASSNQLLTPLRVKQLSSGESISLKRAMAHRSNINGFAGN